MKIEYKLVILSMLAAGFVWLMCEMRSDFLVLPANAQTSQSATPFLVLNNEFFEAMAKLSQSGVTYGDRQEPLLEKIALASQYVVKTNLTLIQQNERIIHLLEELNRKRWTQER